AEFAVGVGDAAGCDGTRRGLRVRGDDAFVRVVVGAGHRPLLPCVWYNEVMQYYNHVMESVSSANPDRHAAAMKPGGNNGRDGSGSNARWCAGARRPSDDQAAGRAGTVRDQGAYRRLRKRALDDGGL